MPIWEPPTRMKATERERWILHADMDAFYASVEQRDQPTLRGRPVIVGGSGKRGVVAAASYEARVFGVRSAMPGFRARELCPQAVFLAPNMARYAEVSSQVVAIFSEFTPDLEPIALDEAFLDVSDSVRLFGGPLALARRLKRRVVEATALNVSVGLGPNKLVAKLACTLSKPDGLLVVPSEAVNWMLDPLPVRRLWGIGPRLAEELTQLGIHTFLQLARYDAYSLRAELGDRAPLLQRMAQGHDVRLVEARREPRSIGEENTFEADVTDEQVIFDTLTAHAERVAHRLRRAGYRGRTVTVKIKLGRRRGWRSGRTTAADEPVYPLLTRSFSLAEPTHDDTVILRVARELWRRAAVAQPIRLLGVSVANLSAANEAQRELFAGKKAGEKLGQTLDAITERFGADAIGRAVGLSMSSKRRRT